MTNDSGLRVSAVIPTWNNAAYLGQALDSVLAQSRAVDEIVVIDDGSTDATAEVVQPYVARGVRYLPQANQGVSAARNRGIRETRGDWIAFLDADDVWEPEKIALQLACVAREPRLVLVSGQAWFWNVREDTRRLMTFGRGRGRPEREIAVRNIIGNTSLVLARRDVLEALGGFDASLRFGEDWDMWIRMLERGPARVVDRPLLLYRWHPGSNSHFKDWQRYDVLSAISRRAIQRTRPAAGRWVLHLRRLAFAHAGRAAYAVARSLPRRTAAWHALAAFVLYPFDETRGRLAALLRIAVGDRLYSRLSRRLPPPSAAGAASP